MVITGNSGPAVTDKLVVAAQQGNQEAFGALVDEYQDNIYNYVARMIRDRTEAEDIAQETFVKAYQALGEFRGASSFQTWLYRIASNLAIDTIRRRKRQGSVSLEQPVLTDEDQVPRQWPDEGPGPFEQVGTAETQQAVREAITTLSPKLRTVIVLYDLEGLSYQQIADILGCPLGTVKSRLFNARNQLHDILAERLTGKELPFGQGNNE